MNLDKTWIIGDVHGCYHTLMQLLQKLPSYEKLIFVGDLCDKGNYTKQVIDFVINNNHTCIYGNHEYLFNTYAKKVIFENKQVNWNTKEAFGGARTIQSYQNDIDTLLKHLSWIKTLPLFIEIENYFITHGFALPYYKRKHLKEHRKKIFSNRIDVDDFKWDWEDFSNYNIINIFGHCNFKEVLKGKNYIGIDTGCVYGNKLTALNLGNLKTIDVQTLKIDIK